MRKQSFWLIAAGLVAAVSLITTGASFAAPSGPTATPRQGGTVIIGADQEPKILNVWHTEGNLYWLVVILGQVFEGAYELNNNGAYAPNMIAGEPKVTRNPFTVTYTLKRGVKWDNNRLVTAADFRYTWQVYITKSANVASRAGYEDIRSVTGSGRTVRVVFKKPYAAWKDLFGILMPRHAMGAPGNFNNAFRNTVTASSGPFKFQSWQKGSQLTLVRNTRYWGKRPFINRVIFRFIPDTETQFQAIRGGEVDMIVPQPQLQIADVRKQRNRRVQSGPEFAWEHIDIQLGAKGHPALKRLYVRQALVSGINRRQIATVLYREIAPGLPVLNNVIFKPFEAGKYQAHTWQPFGFSQRRAIQLLRNNGCTGGPATPTPGNDDIYSCPGVGKLSFRFTTTQPNQLRESAFAIMQQQLRSIGIELRPALGPASQVFGTVLPSGDWDLFMFTWIGSPDPAGSVEIHRCGGDQNYNAYCNRTVTSLLDRSNSETNPTRRTALMNQADRLMARDLPTLPLFARPGFLIHKTSVNNVLKNPTSEGPTWNSEAWHVSAQ